MTRSRPESRVAVRARLGSRRGRDRHHRAPGARDPRPSSGSRAPPSSASTEVRADPPAARGTRKASPSSRPPTSRPPGRALSPCRGCSAAGSASGVGGYPTIDDFHFGQEVTFSTDGRPFLSYWSRTWLLDEQGNRIKPLATETGFWRPQPDNQVEVVLAHPTGYAEVWVGDITVTEHRRRRDHRRARRAAHRRRRPHRVTAKEVQRGAPALRPRAGRPALGVRHGRGRPAADRARVRAAQAGLSPMAMRRVGAAAAARGLPHHAAAPARARGGRAAAPRHAGGDPRRGAAHGVRRQPLDHLPQPRGARGGRARHPRAHRPRRPDLPRGRRPRAHPPRVRPLRRRSRASTPRSPRTSSTSCARSTGFVTDISHVALHGLCADCAPTGVGPI